MEQKNLLKRQTKQDGGGSTYKRELLHDAECKQ